MSRNKSQKYKKCMTCENLFYKKDRPSFSHKKWDIMKYCSNSCYLVSPKTQITKNKLSYIKKGKIPYKMTDEIRKKISNSLKGRPSPVLGKTWKLSEECRRKMQTYSKKGSASNFWKGGITDINTKIRTSFEYKLWREAVFKRDNFTCMDCKEKEQVSGKLQAHHIKSFSFFPELRFVIDNGLTLCQNCHKKTDTYLWKARHLTHLGQTIAI